MKYIKYYIINMLLCATPLISICAMDDPMDVDGSQAAFQGNTLKITHQENSRKREREEHGILITSKKMHHQSSAPASSTFVYELSILPNDVKMQILLFCDIKSFYRMGRASTDWHKVSLNPSLHLPNEIPLLIEWIIEGIKPKDRETPLECYINFLNRFYLLNAHTKDSHKQFYEAFMSYFELTTDEGLLFALKDIEPQRPFENFWIAYGKILHLYSFSEIGNQGTRELTPEEEDFQRKLQTWKPYAVALNIAQMLCNEPACRIWETFEEAGDNNALFKNFILYPYFSKLTGNYYWTLGTNLADMEALKAYHMKNTQRLFDIVIGVNRRFPKIYPTLEVLEEDLSDDAEDIDDFSINYLEQSARNLNDLILEQAHSTSRRFQIMNAGPTILQLKGVITKLKAYYKAIKKKEIDSAHIYAFNSVEGVQHQRTLESFYNKLRTLPGYTVTYGDMVELINCYCQTGKSLNDTGDLKGASAYFEQAGDLLSLLGDTATSDQINQAALCYDRAAIYITNTDPIKASSLYEEAGKRYKRQLTLLGDAATPDQVKNAACTYIYAGNICATRDDDYPEKLIALLKEGVEIWDKRLIFSEEPTTQAQVEEAAAYCLQVALDWGSPFSTQAQIEEGAAYSLQYALGWGPLVKSYWVLFDRTRSVLFEEAGKLYDKLLTLPGEKATPDQIGKAAAAYCCAAFNTESEAKERISALRKRSVTLYKQLLTIIGDIATLEQMRDAAELYYEARSKVCKRTKDLQDLEEASKLPKQLFTIFEDINK